MPDRIDARVTPNGDKRTRVLRDALNEAAAIERVEHPHFIGTVCVS